MFYEKFSRVNDFKSSSKIKTDEVGYESVVSYVERRRESDGNRNEKTFEIDIKLESIYSVYPLHLIALEAADDEDPFTDDSMDGQEDNFDDSDTDTGSDNPFDDDPFAGNDDGFDDGGGDDPFGGSDFGDDSGGFGDEGDDSDKSKKEKAIDREDLIKDDHNLSANIRNIFPKRFLELRDIIDNNIDIAENYISDDIYKDNVIKRAIQEYKRVRSNLDNFLDVIIDKTYEDIFEMYVNLHGTMMKIKEVLDKINKGSGN